ncbi:MAG TPA: hypothetical protein VHT03_07945 [Rhizomicrobium sp.]|nr:hypothetical protein [Rhizomicrobium sp.]
MIITDEPFDVADPTRQGGGTGAVKVVMRASRLTAWAKPEGTGMHHIRDVAHEKIGSDLGFDLGLPVAAVVLSTKTGGKNLHSTVALSYEMLPGGRPLNQIPSDAKAKLCTALSGIFVLLAWIDDHDHFGASNAHFEIVNAGPRLSFFDWGHSLTKQWAIPGPAPDRPHWTNPAFFGPLDQGAVGAILKRIEEFPIKELECIVGRIPADCLPFDAQNQLVQALDQRRRDLRRVLNLAGAP